MTFPKAWAKCKKMGGYIPCPRDNIWDYNGLNDFIEDWYTTKVIKPKQFVINISHLPYILG